MSSENPQMGTAEASQGLDAQGDAMMSFIERNENLSTQEMAQGITDPFSAYDHPIPSQFEAGMRRYGLDSDVPKSPAEIQGEAMSAFMNQNEGGSASAPDIPQVDIVTERSSPAPVLPQEQIPNMPNQEIQNIPTLDSVVVPQVQSQEINTSDSIPVTPEEDAVFKERDQFLYDNSVITNEVPASVDSLAEFGPITQSSQVDPLAEFGPAVSSEKVEVAPSTLLDRLMEEMDAERTQHEKQKGKVLASAAKFLTRPFGMLARLGRATSDSVYKNFYRGYKNTVAVGEGIVEKAEGVVASGQKLMNKTLEAVRTTREEMREKKNNIKRQWILRKLQSLEMEQKQKKDEMAKEETEARNVAEQLLSQIQAQVKRADEIRVARENLNKPISVDSIEPL